MIETIHEGFRTAWRNLLLVPAQIAAWVIVCVLFLVLFVPPVWVMAASGVFAEFGNGDPSLLLGWLTAHKGAVGVLAAVLLVWTIAASIVFFFVQGGTIHCLARSARIEGTFEMAVFWEGGKRFWWPLTVLAGLWFPVILGIILLVGGLGFAAAWWAAGMAQQGSVGGAIVVGVLGVGSSVLLCLAAALLAGAYWVYGQVILVVDRTGGFGAFREGIKFVNGNFLRSIGFYLLLIVGLLAASMAMSAAAFPFSIIPVIGLFIQIPIQFAFMIAQIFLSIVMIASLVHYYLRLVSAPGAGVPVRTVEGGGT
jgi:hypothetical protein